MAAGQKGQVEKNTENVLTKRRQDTSKQNNSSVATIA